MEYVWFTVKFALIHTAAYTVAGSLILVVGKDIYEGKSRLMNYVRDKSDNTESSHVQRWLLPAQLARGILLFLPLYPVLDSMTEAGFGSRALFLGGPGFLYTVPFALVGAWALF